MMGEESDRIKFQLKNHIHPQHRAIAVSPKTKKGDRIESQPKNRTQQKSVNTTSGDHIPHSLLKQFLGKADTILA
jgi:hypothetical protein